MTKKILLAAAALALLSACANTERAPSYAQEGQACAKAGIAPDQAGYHTCVADLDAALAQSRIQIN